MFQRIGVLLADGYTPENQIMIFGMNFDLQQITTSIACQS